MRAYSTVAAPDLARQNRSRRRLRFLIAHIRPPFLPPRSPIHLYMVIDALSGRAFSPKAIVRGRHLSACRPRIRECRNASKSSLNRGKRPWRRPIRSGHGGGACKGPAKRWNTRKRRKIRARCRIWNNSMQPVRSTGRSSGRANAEFSRRPFCNTSRATPWTAHASTGLCHTATAFGHRPTDARPVVSFPNLLRRDAVRPRPEWPPDRSSRPARCARDAVGH